MNVVIQVVFLLLSALILGTAVMVVTARNVVRAALWLVASFFGVGALYLLLEAEFVGVVQVLIYVGAIAVLIIMAIMLTPQLNDPTSERFYQRWWLSLGAAGGLFALLIVPNVWLAPWKTAPVSQTGAPETLAGAREIGTAFMREYLLPFEIASILLLVALVGAIVVVIEDRRRNRILTLAEEVAQRQNTES